MIKQKSLLTSIVFAFVVCQTFAQTVEQGLAAGRDEAQSVLNTFFYKTECASYDPTAGAGSPIISVPCYMAYNQNTGWYDFVVFCMGYQANMISSACNATVCTQRNYTFAVLRGFNEYMATKQQEYGHTYVGDNNPSCTSTCN
ncbi:hypothetical protein WSM22_37670 [Cytophagales bacterium WSM2-2]|nr:hypothetical protein WSM22_37670 [Cytophagales bacterium WSM2-2]